MRLRLLVTLAVLLPLFVGMPAHASEERPTAAELESELVCPVCESTLDTSSAPIAIRMKTYIRTRIAQGATKSQIKDELVEQFGTRVLATPPKEGLGLVAWVLPLAGLGLAACAVGALAWRWSRARADDVPDEPSLDDDAERRLDAELARFE